MIPSLEELWSLAQPWQVAIMCAEAVPWRCHRSLIADALFARGMGVEHIIAAVVSKGYGGRGLRRTGRGGCCQRWSRCMRHAG
jgi:uncharacterized protein (DUF488 family)